MLDKAPIERGSSNVFQFKPGLSTEDKVKAAVKNDLFTDTLRNLADVPDTFRFSFDEIQSLVDPDVEGHGFRTGLLRVVMDSLCSFGIVDEITAGQYSIRNDARKYVENSDARTRSRLIREIRP